MAGNAPEGVEKVRRLNRSAFFFSFDLAKHKERV
jgi:hypothetical protein